MTMLLWVALWAVWFVALVFVGALLCEAMDRK